MQAHHHQKFWLGLHLIPEFGIVRISQLLAHFQGVEELWYASETALHETSLSGRLIEHFVSARKSIDLEKEFEKVKSLQVNIVTLEDDTYPPLLRAIPDPPTLLYVRGELMRADDKCLAVVGTRKPSKYGRDVAYRLANYVAQQDITIISGLAQGIDTASHHGALDSGGRTIAVLGNGIDRIYPSENRELADEIVKNGAIIAEMPIGTAPLAKNFPRRNRIISGMSLGVLVAEAPEKSGSLITVESAIEQGREVFAVPHNIFSKTGRGTNQLIQEGAKLVLRVRDILDELDITHLNTQTKIQTEQVQPENDIEKQILSVLGPDPIHIDEIVRLTQLSTHLVSSTLTILELKGLAEVAGPMQYCRAR